MNTIVYLKNGVQEITLTQTESGDMDKKGYGLYSPAPYNPNSNTITKAARHEVAFYNRTEYAKKGSSYLFQLRFSIGNAKFTLSTTIDGTWSGSDISTRLDYQTFDKTGTTKDFKSGSKSLKVDCPLIGGSSLSYTIEVAYEGSFLGYDDLVISIKPTTQKKSSYEVIKRGLAKTMTTPVVKKSGTSGSADQVSPSNMQEDLATPGGPKPVTIVNIPPYNAIGRLEFDNSGFWSTGSAFLVAPNVIATAFHNVYNGKTMTWYKNFGFDRALNGSRVPANFFSALEVYYLSSAINGDGSINYRYDICFLTLDSAVSSSIPPIEFQTMVKKTTANEFLAVGYPGKLPTQMYSTLGHFKSEKNGIISMNNNLMGKGCSGGPWLVTSGKAGLFLANGINSEEKTIDRSIETSPYFGEEVESLLYITKKLVS